MTTKKLDFILILISLIIFSSFPGLSLAVWDEPTESAPANNREAPVNVSSDYQHKSGGFGISQGINFSQIINDATDQDKYKIGVSTTQSISPMIFANPAYFLWGFGGFNSLSPSNANLALYKDSSSTVRLLLRGRLCLNTTSTADCISSVSGLSGQNLWTTTTGNGIRNANTGFVGIGMTGAPSSLLHVYSTTTLSTIFQSTATSGNQSISIRNGTARLLNIGFTTNNNAYLWTSSTKVQIGDDGNPTFLVNGMSGTSTGSNVVVGGSDATFGGKVSSKFSIVQSDGLTGLAIGNATNPRMALNGNSDGSWTAYDYVGSAWRAGLSQNAGKVGIGTAAPINTGLHIYSTSSDPQVDIQGIAGTNNHWAMYVNRTVNSFNIWGSGASGDNRLTIKSDGEVGIGTSTFDFAQLVVEANNPTINSNYYGILARANGPIGSNKVAIYAETNEGAYTTNTFALAGYFSGKLYADKVCIGSLNDSSCKTSWPAGSSYWSSNDSGVTIYNTNTGNVGIGTSTPNNKLTVVGTVLFKPDAVWSDGDVFYLNLGEGGHYIKSSYSGLDEIKGYNGVQLSSNNGVQLTVLNSTNAVGIGTTTPVEKLDVYGNININSGSAYKYNGVNIVAASTSRNNFFFGNSGNISSNGNFNLSVGKQALNSLTSGSYNIALGYQALYQLTTSSNNIAIGHQALSSSTSGYNNTALGYQSLFKNISGYNNTANGLSALFSNTSGYNNTAIGFGAIYDNDNGHDNTAIGLNSLKGSGWSHYTTAIGSYSGYGSGGNEASRQDRYSTFIGSMASRESSLASTTAYDNMTAIGYNAKVGGSNMLVLGGTGAYAVNVGIGTSKPSSLLNIYSPSSAIINVQGTSTDYRGLRLANLGNSENWFTGANTSNNFVIRRGDTSDEITVNNSSGNIGIGATTTPSQKLTVIGNILSNSKGAFGGYSIDATKHLTTPSLYSSTTEVGRLITTGMTDMGAGSINAEKLCINGDCKTGWTDNVIVWKHYFVTSESYNGNLGGQTGANSKCNSSSAKLSGRTYHAKLTYVSSFASPVSTSPRPVYYSGIFGYQMLDDNYVAQSNQFWFSDNALFDCQEFTFGGITGLSTYGTLETTNQVGKTTLSTSRALCSESKKILCLED